jgi:protoporphyrinogen IX oxidase
MSGQKRSGADVNDFLAGAYNVWRGLHILAVIAWMAGLLYLPRLFAYHTTAEPGSQMDETFKQMERGLFRTIMTPAMGAAFLFGLLLIYVDGITLGWDFLIQPAMVAKLAGVVLLGWYQSFLGRAVADFAAGRNTRPNKFWRMMNEVPFVAAIVMVLAVTIWVRA